jgi:ribosomal protein L9
MGEIIEVTEGYAQNYLIPRIMLMQSLKATRELLRMRRD